MIVRISINDLLEFIINRKTETGAAADEEERDSDGHSKTTHSTLHFTITKIRFEL